MPTATVLAAISYPRIDPVAFHVGPVAVRWYGLAYLLAFVVGYLGLARMIRRGALGIARGELSDLVAWLVFGVVVGGRAGWWLFYHRSTGIEPWYEPLATWHGGMSFHGGLLGVATALLFWSRWRGAPFWNLCDGLALVTPAGLFFGRIANFINAELMGRPTQVSWGVIFPGEAIARHPSQIYEALLEGPLFLLVLYLARRRWSAHFREGMTAGLFLITYGVFRFAVEFTRQPDTQLGFIAMGWLTMGQLLSFAIVLLGATVMVRRGRTLAA